MKKIAAFFLGMIEFNSCITTSQPEHTINAYDWGREWAHRLTFRNFER